MTPLEWERSLHRVSCDIEATNVSAVSNTEELEKIRVRFLGRKGALTEILKSIKDLSLEDRRTLAPKAQDVKSRLEDLIAGVSAGLENRIFEANLQNSRIDTTLPPFPFSRGRLHPLTQIQNQMAHILGLMGFSWAEGPLIETDENNFTALNIPEHHSSRDMLDTFYLEDSKLLLRTHTSPVQIRAMRSQKPPLRIICPGRVFRHEAVDATHSAVFHQIEGLFVDQGVSFADLKGTLEAFLKALFGPKIHVRFRPSYFPFTEPSAEVDLSCLFCEGSGCGICKKSGFIEILGAGMVHPNVFKAVGYDPNIWSGFAFGIGVERVAMLKLGVKDIRDFYENDMRFLSQFNDFASSPLA
jgi:phenylalanyl-tRNA synthetase alpha chain